MVEVLMHVAGIIWALLAVVASAGFFLIAIVWGFVAIIYVPLQLWAWWRELTDPK